MSQPALPLSTRRLLKKIEESTPDEAVAAFKELPRDPDDAALLDALFTAASRVELLKSLLEFIQRKDLIRYSDESRKAIVKWTVISAVTMPTEQFLNYCRWYVDAFYKSELLEKADPALVPIVDRFTVLTMVETDTVLPLFQRESRLLDTWVACVNDDVAASLGPLLNTRLPEEQLVNLFKMLADLEGHDRSRGGELRQKPWLRFVRALWQATGNELENVCCAFIKGWPAKQHDDSVFPIMMEVMNEAAPEAKTYIKAGLFHFSIPYTQYLAKQASEPVFDPLLCFQLVNRATTEATYNAVKWAITFGDTGKFSELVDVVVDGIVKGTTSVLGRYPALFLLVGNLTERWESTHDARKDDIAKAIHQLARHWSTYRSQLEKEAGAENQKHYFSSNAEEVEKKLGKILARTQPVT